ncbi:MAG: hypothetical protein HZA36_03290 [Parcubacteria group bacterium]|nr:hypothetical protein [Parcubacteria group bacterium]
MQETQNVDLEKQIAALQEQLRKKNEQLGQRVEAPTVQGVPKPKEATPEGIVSGAESVSEQPSTSVPLPPKPPVSSKESFPDEWRFKGPRYAPKPSYELPDLAPLLVPFQNDINKLEVNSDHKVFSKALLEEVNKAVLTDNQAVVDALHDWLVEKKPELVQYFCEGIV